MILSALLVTVLLGACITLSISQRLKLIEVLGLAFLLGMGLQTFLMVCLDWAGVRLTATSVLTFSLLVVAGLVVYLYGRRAQLKEWWTYVRTFTWPEIDWLWVLVMLAIIAVATANVIKTIYYPTFDTDSIRGFNLIGLAVAHDGTFKGCGLFTDSSYPEMHGAASYMTYAPLLQFSYAYVYLLGAATSKTVSALFFLSFIAVFYGLLSRFTTHTLAAIATLMTLLTPEMLGFSSMSGTNFVHAVYASLGILCFVTWYYRKVPSLLWMSAALLMLNNWTRTEGIAFIGAACSVLLWHSLRTEQYKKLLLFAGLCLFPIVFWNVFLKIHHLEATQALILKPHWDSGKITVIATEMWTLFKSITFYGLTFIAFPIVLLLNVRAIFKKRDHLVTLLLIVLSWAFYTILIYQVDYVWDTLERVMKYSYKRFLFSFVPLLWFYMAAGHSMSWLFGKINNILFPKKNKRK
ncbi:MAG: hypothetical protein LBF69_01255 [Prevotellaceae bacterium]|jgi:hypothetical protein|nr:hypothetical protein [Prevotellaceae bacterium]